MTVGMSRLRSERLKFLVGINTGLLTNGRPDDRYIEFYRRRSSRLLYCAIVGNVLIPGGYGSNPNTAEISSPADWTELTGAIASRGSLPGIQLATAWAGYSGSRGFRSAKTREAIEISREVVLKLGRAGIIDACDALHRAAELALAAGFRHLQIHAAHGYLFSLLIDRRLNDSAPDVLERMASWALKQSARGAETSIRMSLRTGDEDFDSHGRRDFHAEVAALPFDFVDISSGFYNINKQLIYPGRPDTLEARRSETVEIAERFPQKRFIFSGRALLRSQRDLPSNIEIGICRDLIANPDFLFDITKGCNNSGKCHYFSRGDTHVTCAQWASNST